MKRLLALLLLVSAAALPSPSRAAGPRLVRVTLDARLPLARLLESGADVVDVHPGAWADVLEWPGDEAALTALGGALTVLDENPGRTAALRARADLAGRARPAPRPAWSAVRPDGVFRSESYPPVGFGSLGGFWTLTEIKSKLDDLVASDTRTLVADKLDTLGYSLQGRPVWGLKLAKFVAGPDTRPVAFFNSLTHAREPEGMQALFAFVDDLLARYDTDPAARYLLDNRQIYIVPLVNPDGYSFNQRIYDSTAAFGYWRKNLRDTNNDQKTGTGDGVDINRNFGFKWGLNNIGSSGTPSNDTYRGPSAFSETETRIQRDVVSALRPVTGLSFHTYSDLFVHPWGWTAAGTPDSARFQEWSDELTLDNGFAAGPAPRILYEVNGEFNDWTYGDTLLKPRAYTWTPEVGDRNDGFWPPSSRIGPLAASTLRASWTVAGIAGPWLRAERSTLLEGALNAGGTAHLSVRARNIGASGSAGPGLTARLTAIDHEVEALSGPVGYPSLGSFQSADPSGGATFWIAAADTVTPGRMVRFKLEFTDGSGLYCRDTVEIVVGTPTVLLNDACESLANWSPVTGLWGVVANDPTHPSRYFSDSPGGVTPSFYDGTLHLAAPLDFSHGLHAWAFFQNRWGFESDYDGAVFEGSNDDTTWRTLATRGTTASASTSIFGGGLNAFEGTRWLWRQDRADLSSLAGGPAAAATHLRFRSLTDSGANLDGLSLDSIRVVIYDPAAQPAPVAVGPAPVASRLSLAPPAPNPARDRVGFEFAVAHPGPLAFDVLDLQGRVVYARSEVIPAGAGGAAGAGHFRWGWDLRDARGVRVAPGLYLVRLRMSGGEAVRRVVVLP